MKRTIKIVLLIFLGFPGLALAADPVSSDSWELLSIFEKGGVMMYPILFSSILMLGIAIERLYNLRRKNVINSDFLKNVRSQWDWKDIKKTLQLCNTFDNSL